MTGLTAGHCPLHTALGPSQGSAVSEGSCSPGGGPWLAKLVFTAAFLAQVPPCKAFPRSLCQDLLIGSHGETLL